MVLRAPAFEEALALIDVHARGDGGIELARRRAGRRWPGAAARRTASTARWCSGVRDYVNKHRFPGVVMGLSGGVDSALTLAIAVDALGADRVQVVMMPSRYTSQMSRDDAAAQARTHGRGLQRDLDRGHVRGDAGGAGASSSPAASPTPPKKTSRRAAAACC